LGHLGLHGASPGQRAAPLEDALTRPWCAPLADAAVPRLTLTESAALRLASIFGAPTTQMPDELESARSKLRDAELA
jgi:hypothetical protein